MNAAKLFLFGYFFEKYYHKSDIIESLSSKKEQTKALQIPVFWKTNKLNALLGDWERNDDFKR